MIGKKKILKSGKKYDKYFQPSKQKNTEIARSNVMQTLDIMQDLITRTLSQTGPISMVLKKNNVYDTSKAIWYFLYDHIQYQLDKSGIEQLREPNRTWNDRKADCDCFSIFASSILTNLGIDHSLRITKYNGKSHFQHVYIVVHSNGKEIIIDPVVDAFNFEKPYSEKHDKKMKIRHQILSGFGNTEGASFGYEFDHILNGLGSTDNGESLIEATKNHLINTLRIVEKNPDTISDIANPQTYINQLQFVLRNWDNPNSRMAAIDKVIAMSDSGLSGLRDRLRNAWGSVKSAVSKTSQKVKTAVKNTAAKVADATKKVVNAVVKYNPLTLAMRGGLLFAFKVNLFHFTEKLKLGYLTEAQARANNLDISNWRKIQNILGKVENMFEKIGGDKSNLKKAILTGKKGSLSDLNLSPEALKPTPPISATAIKANAIEASSKSEVVRNFAPQAEFRLAGLGVEPATTATAATAASGLLASIGAWIKNVDWGNVFKKGTAIVTTAKQAANTIKNNNSTSTPPINSGSSMPTQTLPAHNVYANAPEESFMSKHGTKLLIGGGALTAYILLRSMKSEGLGTVEVAI